MEQLTIIGRAEKADFMDLNLKRIPVKIDTGADASSIWASVVEKRGDKLHVIFFDRNSEFYTGEEHVFVKNDYSITRIASSFGHKEIRYKIKLRIKLKGRIIKGTFTLSDRSKKLYPILIGRSLLTKKFLVDVSKGNPLRNEERERAKKLQYELEKMEGEETL